jgi:hypothetical protein
MGKKTAELEREVSEGKPDAKNRLKTFRAERILLVDSIIQVRFHSTYHARSIDRAPDQGSIAFEEWAELEAVAQNQESDNRRIQRHEA